MSTLLDALKAWANTPINDHGTPHLNMPEYYTPAEQAEFCDFVQQDRFVSEEEQRAKHREIMAARKAGA